ncbi:hypothetical protein [Salmonella phage SD-1_S14]|nr:hypothetical protein [Salmonella phage SD-1_S14]
MSACSRIDLTSASSWERVVILAILFSSLPGRTISPLYVNYYTVLKTNCKYFLRRLSRFRS